MSIIAHLTINGEVQGDITSGAAGYDSVLNETQIGFEDTIIVLASTQGTTVPRDPISGNPTGARIHEPFSFTCALNKAMPLIQNSLATGEVLTEVQMKWYRINDGVKEHFYTTTLENARVVDYRAELPHVLDASKQAIAETVTVQLTFNKISSDHEAAGTSHSDSHNTPNV